MTLRGPTALARLVREVADFPSAGIAFQDITPLLGDPGGFAAAVDALAGLVEQPVDVVAGIEARGFILAAPLALRLRTGFVPVRKSGKLPGPTLSAAYGLEYGSDTVEIHADALRPGQRVLVVDDVLATGGTAAAACQLVEGVGGTVTAVAVLVELTFLRGRERLEGRTVSSVLEL